LNAINDSGAIKGLDAREDGVYITYSQYDQHAYGENTSGTDQYSMTIIYAVE
jgi:hypothetical protein